MTRHQPEAQRRSQILAAAREVFVEQGFVNTRVDDVARRAHLSKGAVYFYFESKQALFTALVLAEHEETYRILDELEHSELRAIDKLTALGMQYMAYFARVDQPPRFFLLMTELAVRDAGLREECQALHQRFVDAVARILAQGIGEGLFRPVDPVAVAELLKATVDGFAGQAAIGIDPNPAHIVADGFGVILRGLVSDPHALDTMLANLATADEDRS